MYEKSQALLAGFRWFHWVALVGLGLLAGLLVIIVVNTHPQKGNSEEKKVAAAVALHVLLPTDETPALATITDPSKLRNNQFLRQGQKGDKVLIFAKWKQAVIYRPSADRVIDIGPVDVAPPGGNSSNYNP